MARNQFSFQKRQKELAKKKKREEKLARKQESKQNAAENDGIAVVNEFGEVIETPAAETSAETGSPDEGEPEG